MTSVMFRPKMAVMRITGSAVITVAAASWPISISIVERNRPRVTVSIDRWDVKSSGVRNSTQARTNPRSNPAKIPGLSRGRTMRKISWGRPAPSIRAISSTETGIDRTNDPMIQTMNGRVKAT